MARQIGIVRFQGTIGDLTFLKTRESYEVRQKSTLSAERIRTDAAFQRTRENAAEFGLAGKAGRLIRSNMQKALKGTATYRLAARIQKDLMAIVQTDGTSPRGQRCIADGDLQMIQGFDFNAKSNLDTAIYAPYEVTIDRVTGEVKVEFAAFVPIEQLTLPEGATHFKLLSAAGEFDFRELTSNAADADSGILPIDDNATPPITLTTPLSAGTTKTILLSLGINFYQRVGGTFYPLKNGNYNAMKLVKVDLA